MTSTLVTVMIFVIHNVIRMTDESSQKFWLLYDNGTCVQAHMSCLFKRVDKSGRLNYFERETFSSKSFI